MYILTRIPIIQPDIFLSVYFSFSKTVKINLSCKKTIIRKLLNLIAMFIRKMACSLLKQAGLPSWSMRNQSMDLNGHVVLNIAQLDAQANWANDGNKGGSRLLKLTMNFMVRLPDNVRCSASHRRVNLYSYETVRINSYGLLLSRNVFD